MNRQAQSAVLFLLGASLLHAATTDLYLRYVKQGLRPLVLLSGAVLIAAAVATVWYERKRARDGGASTMTNRVTDQATPTANPASPGSSSCPSSR